MKTLEARVHTPRAARYVDQLTSHFTHQPGGMTILSSAPGELLIDLGEATWSLSAAEDVLLMRLQAARPDQLDELSARVGDRIEQIGRRDGLQVRWQPVAEGLPNLG